MDRFGQHPEGCCHEQRPDRRDFGARAYLSYIAGGFSLEPEVSALSFCFDKEIYIADGGCGDANDAYWSRPGFAGVIAVLPGISHALGLGDVHLNSPLNAPLDAEIELVNATPEDLATLDAKLASKETFARYGLDWPPFMSTRDRDARSFGERRAGPAHQVH